MNCDCFRELGKSISENRYYYDPRRNNTITYIEAFGNLKIHGHWRDPVQAAREPLRQLLSNTATFGNHTNQSGTIPRVGPMPELLPDVWEGGWDFTVEHHIAQIQPNVLIMNAGKWPNDFHQPAMRQALLNATQMARIPRVIWKTTTADQQHQYTRSERNSDHAMCEIMECFNITSWTLLIPTRFYHDKQHFFEPAYHKMNELLFDFLGSPLPGGRLSWSALNISDEMVASVVS